jgi:hypothetical protein
MGALAKALSPASARQARAAGLWPDLMQRLDCCLYPAAVDEFEHYVTSLGLRVPPPWIKHIEAAVRTKREEIEEENVTRILFHKFDF